MLNIENGSKKPLPIVPDITETSTGKKRKVLANFVPCTFVKHSNSVMTGNGNGILTTFDLDTLEIQKTFKIGGPVKSILFSPLGDYFLVNSDKTLKLFNSETHQFIREFRDPINSPQWKSATYSNDQEFIIAGSAEKPVHNIYIWSIEGMLFKRLEGPTEGVMHLEWHPFKPVLASCSTQGVVFIWSVRQTENWSAFAPDFQELTENLPYIEKEDEFDIVEDKVKAEDDVLRCSDNEISDKEENIFEGEEIRHLPPTIPQIRLACVE